jgi:hypothetical protein
LISKFEKPNESALISGQLMTNELKNDGGNDNENEERFATSNATEEALRKDLIATDEVYDLEYIDSMSKLGLDPIAVTNFSDPMISLAASAVKNSKWEIGLGLSHWSKFPSNKKDGLSAVQAEDPLDIALLEGTNFKKASIHTVRRTIGAKFHVGYRLGKRFRLTSGLFVEGTTYAQDKPTGSSLFASSDEGSSLGLDKYKVMSLGIPLGVEYDFIKHKRFSMGTGLNVLNEIPILEKYNVGNSAVSSNKNGIVRNFVIGYDLGFNLNLNASYALNERLRIQANPGVRWYIKQSESYALFQLPKRKAWFGGSVNLIWRL